ncbi:MAG TPA: hypothetical protein VHM30_04190 [Gemmatimonadaceae bacterium]|nr:hypothetical protein [Gemmatimonadaceae bacterium]
MAHPMHSNVYAEPVPGVLSLVAALSRTPALRLSRSRGSLPRRGASLSPRRSRGASLHVVEVQEVPMRHSFCSALGGLALLFAGACAENPTGPASLTGEGPSLSRRGGGSALSAALTASGFDEARLEYDWSFENKVFAIWAGDMEHMIREASTSRTTVRPGETKWLEYRFTATRDQGTTSLAAGVRGAICVSNAGGSATQGLAITQTVQAIGAGQSWQNLLNRDLDISAKPVLAAGESYCYPYEIAFAPAADAQYRAVARVVVSNGASVEVAPALFTKGSRTLVVRDSTAVVEEGLLAGCHNIFPSVICTFGNALTPVEVHGTTSFDIVVDQHNFHVCGETLAYVNRGTLTEGGPRGAGETAQVHAGTASVDIDTGSCAPKPASPGCTLTQGYWKNHAWPEHPLFPPSTLETWEEDNGWADLEWYFPGTHTEWKEMLSISPKGDAYYILAHQYIAAILNQQNGAYVPAQVRSTLVFAYDYFSMTPAQRATVSRAKLIAAAALLDAYNNGRLGVPHCG